jgi:hypothetical protein
MKTFGLSERGGAFYRTMGILYILGALPFGWIGYHCVLADELWQTAFCALAVFLAMWLAVRMFQKAKALK